MLAFGQVQYKNYMIISINKILGENFIKSNPFGRPNYHVFGIIGNGFENVREWSPLHADILEMCLQRDDRWAVLTVSPACPAMEKVQPHTATRRDCTIHCHHSAASSTRVGLHLISDTESPDIKYRAWNFPC